jgi:uncharacterized protein with PQ loop repeat
MRDKVLGFSIEVFDLIIYLILWASLWGVYDYLVNKYVGAYHTDKVFKFNILVFLLGIIALLVRNMIIYKYNPF